MSGAPGVWGGARTVPTNAEEWMAKFGDWFVPEPNTGCWLWNRKSEARKGYGLQVFNGASRHAHRVAWILMRGPVSPDLDIDHLCRVRCCVNPDHLEAVTRRVNLLRGMGACAINARKTHCPLGHPLSGYNLMATSHGRTCRACSVESTRRWRARKAREEGK